MLLWLEVWHIRAEDTERRLCVLEPFREPYRGRGQPFQPGRCERRSPGIERGQKKAVNDSKPGMDRGQQSHKEKSVKGGRKTAEFTLDTLFCWLSCRRGKRLSVRSVTSPCASLSVPAEESKRWSATIFYLLYSLIGKPKLILQIKNKPLTVSLLHFQSRPRGSKLHYILGRIYARIYPFDRSATTIL